jgi:hypothetical protein
MKDYEKFRLSVTWRYISETTVDYIWFWRVLEVRSNITPDFKINQWSRDLLEKLIVAQLVKCNPNVHKNLYLKLISKFMHFIKNGSSCKNLV